MSTVLLVRHGRTAANASGVLAGRAAGVALDDVGRKQVAQTAERLADIPLTAVVSSPLMRCRQTARAIVARQQGSPATPLDRNLTEADYGQWQGRPLSELSREALWSDVQNRPSTAVFPGGEAMTAMQQRALGALRHYDELYGDDTVWAAVSHADIIKSVLAHAQGLHLDQFQRIAVAPASVSVVRFGERGAELIAANTDAADLAGILARSGR